MKPIIRILLILIISFAFCQLMFVFFQRGEKAFCRHKSGRLNELLQNNSKYDLIFLGSSIVHGNINPRIIDSICNVSSYNAGVEGGNLLEFKMMFDAYLENHPAPKMVMLTLDYNSFNIERKFFNHLDYYPHLSNKVVDQVLRNNGHQTALLKIFPFIELVEYDEEMRSRCVKGLMGKHEILPGQTEYKGYLTTSMQFNDEILNTKNHFVEEKITEDSYILFQGIRDTCRARNIKLVINFPTIFKKEGQKNILNTGKIYKLICNLASDNKLPFLDHNNLSFRTDSSLFIDFVHLNRGGADFYSTILAKDLSGLINDPQ